MKRITATVAALVACAAFGTVIIAGHTPSDKVKSAVSWCDGCK